MPLPPPTRPIRLYRHPLSGHCHRVELFLSLLGLPFENVNVDLPQREHKRPEFLALNPFGQVPAIDDDGVVLYDSNAILVYLATRYGDASWLPRDAVGAARVQGWLSAAAGPLASGAAAARVVQVFKQPRDATEFIAKAHALCAVIEAALAAQGGGFITGAAPTIADIALYSYHARAPEGNVSLDAYPQLRAWLARIEALPGFLPMAVTRVGLMADAA